jgi:hypothetical protein
LTPLRIHWTIPFKGRDIVVIFSVQADTGQLLQFTLMLIHSLGTDAPLSPAAYSSTA